MTLGLFLARNPLVVMYTILNGLFVMGSLSYTNAGRIFPDGCPKESLGRNHHYQGSSHRHTDLLVTVFKEVATKK